MFDVDFAAVIQRIAVSFVPMMLGIVLHEVAHGWVAFLQGDPTARNQGRLTLNPVAHLDAMGSLMFVLTSMTGSFVIGWAKPVPVYPQYFRKPRKGMALVSAAGPATNFMLACCFAVAYKLLVAGAPAGMDVSGTYEFFLRMCASGIWINVVLCWFNLLPFPPLDGSHILEAFLPPALAWQYRKLQRVGFVLVIVLLASGFLGKVVGPLVQGTVRLICLPLGL